MTDLELNYPPELPVSEHRAEILAALKTSPVVIVCGDTGSGKNPFRTPGEAVKGG